MTPAALSKVQRFCFSSTSLSGMLLILVTMTAEASDRLNWPVRTGPGLNSLIPAEDAAGLPTEWSEEPSKNIAWKLDLEGFGHSVPVVGFGKIWLTAATKDGKQQFI